MHKKISYGVFLVLLAILKMNLIAQGVDPGTANLTHSWTFNDGTTNDYFGGANGTLMGAAEVYEGSLLVVTPGSYMEMPADNIAINTYPAITIEAWFRSVASGNASYTMLAYFGDTQNSVGVDGYFFCAARGDDKSRAAISCGVYSSPWTGEDGANGPEYDDGEIHHMVSTLNATEITLYIDGLFQASAPLDTNNSIARISPIHAYLAKSGYNDDATWVGEILEFNIYNKTLSADEVLFLFARGASTTGVWKEIAGTPKEYRLLQNYPNPFNPTTTIEFSVPRRSTVRLVLMNAMGQIVRELTDREFTAGTHQVKLDASSLSSGVYFCRMQSDNFVDAKKIVLMK
jgi:hypothetical protein